MNSTTALDLLRWCGRCLVLPVLGALLAVALGSLAGIRPGAAGLVGLGLGILMLAVLPDRFRWGRLLDGAPARPAPFPERAAREVTRESRGLSDEAESGVGALDLLSDPKEAQPFEFALRVDRHQDLVRVQRLTQHALSAVDRVLADPKPFSTVEQVGDLGVVLRVCGWLDADGDWGKTRTESIRAVRTVLGNAGVRMPGADPVAAHASSAPDRHRRVDAQASPSRGSDA